jgi:alcohol dehydrogenase
MNLAFVQHSFALPTRVEYGPGVHEKIGALANQLGCRKAMLITDAHLVRTGLAEKVITPLREAGLEVSTFDQVTTEPTDVLVEAGTKVLKDTRCDLVVALGGGSAMDCAKCVNVMTDNPGRITDYEGAESQFPHDTAQPLITLPTTSGSGAEIAGWAVITDTARSYKMSLGSPYLTPDYALVDPVLTLDLPPRQTAYSGFDALSQAIEGMLSRRRSPISIALGMHAVQLLAENLPRAVARGYDLEARSNMATGSLLAGIVINLAGCIAVHSLAESVGGFYHVPHGLAVALFLAPVLRFNFPGDHTLLAQIAEAMGENTEGLSEREAAELAMDHVEQLLDELKFPTLADVGVKDADIPKIAALALGNVCTADNPCSMNQDDFEAILRAAMASGARHRGGLS